MVSPYSLRVRERSVVAVCASVRLTHAVDTSMPMSSAPTVGTRDDIAARWCSEGMVCPPPQPRRT